MMETNSTDEERASSRTPGSKAERPESPPREYVGEWLPLGQRSQSIHIKAYIGFFIIHLDEFPKASYIQNSLELDLVCLFN